MVGIASRVDPATDVMDHRGRIRPARAAGLATPDAGRLLVALDLAHGVAAPGCR